MMSIQILNKANTLFAAGNVDQAEHLLSKSADETACAVRLREWLIGERRDEEATRHILALAGGSGPEALVSQSILALRQGDVQGAARACQQALQIDASSATAHHHLGRALHNAGQAGPALQAFRQATSLEHNYPEAWNSLGHALRANGDEAGAIRAFEQALERSPAYRQAALNLAGTLFNSDRVQDAHVLFGGLLERNPLDVDALLGDGLCQQLFGRQDEAAGLFQRAISAEPHNALAHLYLGTLMNELTDTEAALAALQKSTELDPGDIEAWVELGGVYEQANRLEEATAALLKGFEVDPSHPGLNLETAKVERRGGHTGAAVRRLRTIDPSFLPPRMAQQYWFELGLALDREHDSDAAIDAFSQGNQLARQGVRSRAMDAEAFDRRLGAMDQWLDDEAKGASPKEDDPREDDGSDLCFLVGFPRSGTTLIDTTLETHPKVAALEEAATLDFVIGDLAEHGGGYPQSMVTINGDEVARLRRVYRNAVASTIGDRTPSLIVDKMPLRFMHTGLINRLFPAARMLFVLRHPCDVVLSNFMQQYADNETNIHFDTLEHCADMYDRIMRQWWRMEKMFPLAVEYVRYEDLVADTEGSISQVCEFLGINRENVSLDREARLETRDRVRTSSYQQVAEPIYERAAGRWTRYRRHLEPVLPQLRPHMERFGYGE